MQHRYESGLDWERKIKLMLAAGKGLPITAFGMDRNDAGDLYMVRSHTFDVYRYIKYAHIHLMYIDENIIPRCYLQFSDCVVKTALRAMWTGAPELITTQRLGIFFNPG